MHRHHSAWLIAISCLSFLLSASAEDRSSHAHTLNRSDGSTIIYYLDQHTPELPAKVLLVAIQGSDCNSVTKLNSIHDDFRAVWSAADLLTVEKYGIDATLTHSTDAERKDCPKDYLKNDSPALRASDITQALDQVLKEYHYNDVILIGGSEGALVANLVASSSGHVTASIVFNGGGRWFVDDMLHSLKFQTTSPEEYNETARGLTGFTQQVLSSEPYELEMSGHGYAWWRNTLAIDQLAILQKIDSPMLIIQSGEDKSVSPQSVQQMMLSLRESGKDNISFLVYDDLDHQLNDKDNVNKASTVVNDMQAWLTTLLK